MTFVLTGTIWWLGGGRTSRPKRTSWSSRLNWLDGRPGRGRRHGERFMATSRSVAHGVLNFPLPVPCIHRFPLLSWWLINASCASSIKNILLIFFLPVPATLRVSLPALSSPASRRFSSPYTPGFPPLLYLFPPLNSNTQEYFESCHVSVLLTNLILLRKTRA